MLSIALSKKCGVLLAHTLSITCCMTFLIWVLTFISKHHWSVTLRPLLTQYRREEGGQKHSSQTYYHRHCDRRDFSTSNFTDLIIKSDWDSTMAAANLLTHGVSVFPNVLDQETSQVRSIGTFQQEKTPNSDNDLLPNFPATDSHDKSILISPRSFATSPWNEISTSHLTRWSTS